MEVVCGIGWVEAESVRSASRKKINSRICRVFDNRSVCFVCNCNFRARILYLVVVVAVVVAVIAEAKQTFSFLINFYALLSFRMLFHICVCEYVFVFVSLVVYRIVRSIFLDFVLKFRSRSRSRFWFFMYGN